MAKNVSFTDDLDGSSGASERHFSIGDTDYSIDLTDKNWQDFLNQVEYIRQAARVKRKGVEVKLTEDDRKNIRIWAAAQGTPLKERGRFPNNIVEAYFASLDD